MYIVAIIFGVLGIVGSVFGWVTIPKIWWVWGIQILMECVYIYFAIMARQAGINKRDIRDLEQRIEEQDAIISILMGNDIKKTNDGVLVIKNEKYLQFVKTLPVIKMGIGMMVMFKSDYKDQLNGEEFIIPKGTKATIYDIQGDEYFLNFEYCGKTYTTRVFVDELENGY